MRFKETATFLSCVLGVAGLFAPTAQASSHREAPSIAEDPYADNTDTYVFISPEDPNNLVIVANYVPLLAPASGPNFHRFSDNVLYEIRVDNDGDARADLSYEFRFETAVGTGSTFLYNVGPVTTIDDADLNVRQTYTLSRRDLATGTATVVASDVPVAPWNVGRRSFPDYDAVAAGAVRTAGTTTVFAGPRRESFAVDFNVFDLLGLGPRATDATPDLTPNYASGYNVMSLVLRVPITEVAAGGVRPAAGSTTPSSVLGVYATASRRQVTILRRRAGSPTDHEGQWVMVSRLAIPLVNEVLIPLADKDDFNRTLPHADATNYGATILNPELNGLLIGVIPELGCTPTPSGGNATILAIITGAALGVAAPGATPADLLRIRIQAGETFSTSGFPNGRRIGDDVLTAEVNVICTGDPSMPLPPNVISGPAVPGVTTTFPYLPSPITPD